MSSSTDALRSMNEAKSTYLETPNLTRIATEGMRFTRGYAPAPLCTPTRRAIVCGASAARSGTEFASRYVPHEHMTLPKALKIPVDHDDSTGVSTLAPGAKIAK